MRLAPGPWSLVLACATLLASTDAGAEVEVVRASPDGAEVSFTYAPPIAVSSVSVAGSFNSWNKDAHPLLDPDRDGVFEVRLPLPWGKHLYKFVVDGRLWQPDSDNPLREADGFDGFNSVAAVGRSGPEAEVGDDRLDIAALLHGPGIEYRERVASEGLAILRLRTAAEDVRSCRVVFEDGRKAELDAVYSKDGFSHWEAESRLGPKPVRYAFQVEDGKAQAWLGASGVSASMPAKAGLFVFDRRVPQLDVPAWVKDAVFYQVFPERFRDGDPSNNPPGCQAWGAIPSTGNHFGGDLDGIREGLPYLADLGITALYLNPVFSAPSNHKYDTADYRTVDAAFGGDAAFERLTQACRRAGIRVVLDGVFNHSGDRFWAFQDLLKNGADSAYAKWYTVRSFPVTQDPPNYEAWWGFGHLPKLDTSVPALRRYLLETGAAWLARGASGWRLDVPNEVPHDFWKEFRKAVRRARPDSYIVGELWEDGLPWLQGDEFDAVMNYPFRQAVLDFFGPRKGGVEAFHAALLEPRHRYPRSSLAVQFNLLGSHDTPRLATVLAEDRRAHRLAALFQMTYLGAPVIYYGDEVGLAGAKDPDCRRTFPWDEDLQDRGLREHYKRLIKLRRSRAELRRGSVQVLLADEASGVYAFSRRLGKEASLVVLHRGEGQAEVSLGLPAWLAAPVMSELVEGGSFLAPGGRLAFMLGPWQGVVLAPDRR
ncbi:MAG: alpha amylase N-terminal ig-like domain-containing protein [Elusimicrobia bacterium]|nr:alpha amylase N-terminal ig-like domain-containing protein [Elusimicrobiota bacterium]